MKTYTSLIAFFCFFSMAVLAQEANTTSPVKIPASEAKQYVGTNAVVTGTIAEVNKAEKLVRLNFDKPFPKQTFTAIIFASRTNLFPEVDQLKGKKVEISGKITEYRGRPQIELVKTNQIRVLPALLGAEPQK